MVVEPKIPKKLHMIWVGDDKARPDEWIATWRVNHPDWDFRLWGNVDLENGTWICRKQLRLLAEAKRWEGVADVMRYEILYRHGGVYVDCDSVSLRPLDDRLLATPLFAVWESEEYAPGLIANGFIGAVQSHPALAEMIARIGLLKDPLRARRRWLPWVKKVASWKSTGPELFTRVIQSQPPGQAAILPSVMFLPRHYREATERVADVIYARHFWTTTINASAPAGAE